jgi:D-alanine-D-alanine ligase
MNRPYADKRIGVLMGGKSGERDVSLRSGKGVLESLKRQGYDAVGVDVDEKVDMRLREEKVELAFIVLHGIGGEDGTIQGLLETLGIPYTGSGVAASALSMDKYLTKLVLGQHGLPFPATVYLEPSMSFETILSKILDRAKLPVILKPPAEGSSLGIVIAHNEEELRLETEKLLKAYPLIIAEPFITGCDITVGVLGVGASLRALPILEMVPKKEFYDFEAKYTKGMTDLICPARLDEKTTREVQSLAIATHRALGCHGVSRVDFVVDKQNSPFILELNTIPGMTETSDLPEEIRAEGGSYDSLVLEILAGATLDS